MPSTPRTQPTRAEQLRSGIIIVQLMVLLGAIYLQNLQRPPAQSEVLIYVSQQVIFAATLDGEWEHGLLPLYKDCTLHWSLGEQTGSFQHEDMAYPLDTGDWLPNDAQVALTYMAEGDLVYMPGHPVVTVRAANGDLQIWTECPPPAPRDTLMAVYVQADKVYLVNTDNRQRLPLLELQSELLWSSTTSFVIPTDMIATYREEPTGTAWLPADAQLIGTFTAHGKLTIDTLDSSHVMLRHGGGELVLMSD
jgi:hypothetical protein